MRSTLGYIIDITVIFFYLSYEIIDLLGLFFYKESVFKDSNTTW